MPMASGKLTPCFARFAAALVASHSNSTPQGYPIALMVGLTPRSAARAAVSGRRGPAGWAWAVARPGLPRIRTCALTHPARRGNGFAARRYPPQLRQDRISDRCPIGLSLQRFRAPVPLFPPRGPSAVPPLRRDFRSTPTPHVPSHLVSLPSLGSTAMVSFHSLPQEVGHPTPVGLDLW